MILDILRHTPPWVWLLLVALLALGLAQTRARRVPRLRTLALPLAMLLLGANGVMQVVGGRVALLGLWLAAVVAVALTMRRGAPPAGARWDGASRVFELPGSWWPLALISTLFTLKYAVAVTLAIVPALRDEPVVAVALAVAYGALNGVFLGRAWRLQRLIAPPRAARQPAPQAAAQTAAQTEAQTAAPRPFGTAATPRGPGATSRAA